MFMNKKTKVIGSIREWKMLHSQELANQSIGFVPTMGNLHQGHLSLCHASFQHHDLTVVSIFVNPTQFNDSNDLAKYPRSLEADLALLESIGVDYCLVLSEDEMYQDKFQYRVAEHSFSEIMEGACRPGHFSGVLTIVLKLLLGVLPNRVYMGEKDYQQYLLIDGMVKAFFLDCEIVPCPTIREGSGLPFSSRNSRLSVEEKQLAEQFSSCFLQPDLSLDDIRKQIEALGIVIDYLSEDKGRRWIAVRIGAIRILDNYSI
jgi:pantoate--beta-alanine ligase